MGRGIDLSSQETGASIKRGTRSRKAVWLAGAAAFIGGFATLPLAAHAQSAAGGDVVGEIVVTASRRSESATKLPFNISAYGAEQLERGNVTSVSALSNQVPGFVVQDQGARAAEASIPIIRGINASGGTGVAPRYFQSPVGFYLGNSPVVGAFPLMDLERVEVLRGPQGTLYGAGALSGAVRFAPKAPILGEESGYLSVGASDVSYSSSYGHDVLGAINVPVGTNAALRLVAKHEFTAGVIDVHDVLRRAGDDYARGVPLRKNPGDVYSPGVYFDDKDSDYSKTTAARLSALWQVTDALKLESSFSYAKYSGVGGPTDNYTYQGGASPIDPRRTLAATGKYERSSPTLEPYSRQSKLGSIDVSYDLGFATLSGTATYGETSGEAIADGSVALLGSPVAPYYTGTPANPRPAINVTNYDSETSKTEEIRLVSKSGGAFDYVVGAFFQQQKRHRGLDVWNPGVDDFTAETHGGSTLPIALGGTYIPLHDDGAVEHGATEQRFNDKSLFGDLTWHVTDKWQITGGARAFKQTFRQERTVDNAPFFINVAMSNRQRGSSQIFKLNSSYQFAPTTQVYATFSQGYRRGGGNAFAVDGPLREPSQLLTYSPDKTNNFEIGAKGYLGRIRYAVDAFHVKWDNPQIDITTPVTLAYVVINAKGAVSDGIEAEMSGPLGPKGLTFNMGFSYARARLSDDFALPAGDGAGGEIQNAIVGSKGDRLPGAPDFSGSATLNYEYMLADDQSLLFALGADFRSSTVSSLPYADRNTPYYTAPSYALLRGSIGYRSQAWEVTLYGDNLANRHVVLIGGTRTATSLAQLGGWGDSYTVSRPREVGLRLTRRW